MCSIDVYKCTIKDINLKKYIKLIENTGILFFLEIRIFAILYYQVNEVTIILKIKYFCNYNMLVYFQNLICKLNTYFFINKLMISIFSIYDNNGKNYLGCHTS